MGNLADAIAKAGFTAALQNKHEQLEIEHDTINAQLTSIHRTKPELPKKAEVLRESLVKLRQMLARLPEIYRGKATPEQKAKVKAALERFLAPVPINAAGRAVLRPFNQRVWIIGSGRGRICLRPTAVYCSRSCRSM